MFRVIGFMWPPTDRRPPSADYCDYHGEVNPKRWSFELYMGHVPPGTLVKDEKKSIIYIVQGDYGQKQRMIPLQQYMKITGQQ